MVIDHVAPVKPENLASCMGTSIPDMRCYDGLCQGRSCASRLPMPRVVVTLMSEEELLVVAEEPVTGHKEILHRSAAESRMGGLRLASGLGSSPMQNHVA